MRTIFTGEDIKNIIEIIFNGNLKQSRLSRGKIPYSNKNSEKVLLVDEDSDEKTEIDLAEYLNINFYNWKERLVSKDDKNLTDMPELSTFETFVQSLNLSLNEAYALVETIDEEATPSQDIDSASKIGKVTFLIQTNKIVNLEYYITKIRNLFLGEPQEIQNSYGDIIKAYIMIGALMYDQEPIMTQIGECIQCSLNFKLTYLANALTYSDTKVEISLNGDDLYDIDGNIVDANGNPTKTKYLTMPITKQTWQNIFTSTPVATQERPDLTGFISTSLSTAKTLSFYDFNKDLTLAFNDLFWRCGCYRFNGIIEQKREVNVPVFIRVTSNGNTYVYKDVIDNMQKTISNGDFNLSSITLKGWGKIE